MVWVGRILELHMTTSGWILLYVSSLHACGQALFQVWSHDCGTYGPHENFGNIYSTVDGAAYHESMRSMSDQVHARSRASLWSCICWVFARLQGLQPKIRSVCIAYAPSTAAPNIVVEQIMHWDCGPNCEWVEEFVDRVNQGASDQCGSAMRYAQIEIMFRKTFSTGCSVSVLFLVIEIIIKRLAYICNYLTKQSAVMATRNKSLEYLSKISEHPDAVMAIQTTSKTWSCVRIYFRVYIDGKEEAFTA